MPLSNEERAKLLELENEQLQLEEEESQSSQGNSAPSEPQKPPTVGAMIAPTAARDLTPKEKSYMDESVANKNNFAIFGPSQYNPAAGDPRVGQAIGDVLNTGTRALGAIIPLSATRGVNPETGDTKTFKEAMADTETGLFRPIREAASNNLQSNIQEFKDDPSLGAKVVDAMKAAGWGGALMLATATEPSITSMPGLVRSVSKFGRGAAKALAESYIKETGVAAPALERLAENGGQDAIKAASHDVDVDFQHVVASRLKALRDPKYAALDAQESRVMDGFQERLNHINEEKTSGVLKSKEDLHAKLANLDDDIRGFVADFNERQMKVGNEAPSKILNGQPPQQASQAGAIVQSNLSDAEKNLSNTYGEVKGKFGMDEARNNVIPGNNNVLEDAWNQVKHAASEKYGGRNAIGLETESAFSKAINNAAPAGGPATLGELINARRHIGRAIFSKSGVAEQDALFRTIAPEAKNQFYNAINDRIGTELKRNYMKQGIPENAADAMVEKWHEFNSDYSDLRSGLETISKKIGYSASNGKPESYPSKIWKMGVGDIRKAKAATTSSDVTKDVWSSIESAAMNDLVSGAMDEKGNFIPSKFFDKWGELNTTQREKLDALFGADKVTATNRYAASLKGRLDELDALSKEGTDGLVRRIADKMKMTQGEGTAKDVFSRYRKVKTQGLNREQQQASSSINQFATKSKQVAMTQRDANLSAIEQKRAEVDAIGKIFTGDHGQDLNAAMTPANMLGPKRKRIVDALAQNLDPETANHIQDVYFAKAIGARNGSIPLMTRMPTGRALLMGMVTMHPLASVLATSPQAAAWALRYSKPLSRMDKAVDAMWSNPKIKNLFQMLGGIKKVESRNRVILRIMQELDKDGIQIPDIENAPAEDTTGANLEAAN